MADSEIIIINDKEEVEKTTNIKWTLEMIKDSLAIVAAHKAWMASPGKEGWCGVGKNSQNIFWNALRCRQRCV